jgi:hypothetical protein
MIMTGHLGTAGQSGQLAKIPSPLNRTLVHGYRMHFLQANEIGDCSRYHNARFRVLRTAWPHG